MPFSKGNYKHSCYFGVACGLVWFYLNFFMQADHLKVVIWHFPLHSSNSFLCFKKLSLNHFYNYAHRLIHLVFLLAN